MNQVKKDIEELLYNNASNLEIAKVLKKEIKRYFETLEDSFKTSGGKDFLVKHTKKIDEILKLIYLVAKRDLFGDYAPMKNSIPISLVALGSYGREQLCVYSDIDLLIVYKDISGYNTKDMIEKILYILWDTGLKLGHRVHTVEDLFVVSKTDITIKTALIESRFIEGSSFVWTEAQNSISKIRHDDIKKYIELKLEEQKIKHKKFPLTMEPNLKDGIGGFRDANLVYWTGKILYNASNIKTLPSHIVSEDEYRIFHIALEFLFRVRSALHLVTKKKEDKLRLELIPDMSMILGFKEGRDGQVSLAKKVTESLKIVRLYSSIWLTNMVESLDIEIEAQKSTLCDEKSKSFRYLLQELCTNGDHPFTAHPTYLQKLINAKKPDRHDEQLLSIVYNIFERTSSFSILKTLSNARLLKYTIPPIKRVVDMPQFDGYHQYAVDIHSLASIYYLENIDDKDIETMWLSLTHKEKTMLKLVTFLHDAGKGRKRDHHFVGASLFKVFAQKLNMEEELITVGIQLITYHTLMSRVAQREDLYSEKIILSFTSHFKSKRLLDMIYLLTYADMKGVGGDVYNSFSAKLIKLLYNNSVDALAHSQMLDEASKRVKKEQSLKKDSNFLLLKNSEQKKILQTPSNLLFLRYGKDKILDISKKAFETDTYTYTINNNKYLTIEIIRRESFNLGYLLDKLSKLDVVNLDICKLFDNLKYFKIDFAHTSAKENLDYISNIVEDAFSSKAKPISNKPMICEKEIDIDCNHTKTYALMYLNCHNQKGLLAFVISQFDDMNIDIVTSKIHTIKNRTKDMFLIEKNGSFCVNLDSVISNLTVMTKTT